MGAVKTAWRRLRIGRMAEGLWELKGYIDLHSIDGDLETQLRDSLAVACRKQAIEEMTQLVGERGRFIPSGREKA